MPKDGLLKSINDLKGLIMESQLLSVIAAITWEAIKEGVKLTFAQLRKKLQERKIHQVQERDCEKITNIINNIPDEYRLNELLVKGWLQSNAQLIDVLSKYEKGAEETTSIFQTHYGSGDNIGHDKIIKA